MIAEQPRDRDAEARLTHALTRHAAAAGVKLDVENGLAQPWFSATFEGVQLHLTLSAAPAAKAQLWLDGLSEAELPMCGHIAMPPAFDRVGEHSDRLVAQVTMLVLVDG